MELPINDSTIKRFEAKTDAELARTFLSHKHLPKITFEYFADESLMIMKTTTKDGTVKYPYYSALQNVDRTFFIGKVTDTYFSLVHDPKKYDIKFEQIIALYDKVLADNWEVYKSEEIKIEKKSRERGERERTSTTYYNFELITKVLSVVSNINLNNINSLSV